MIVYPVFVDGRRPIVDIDMGLGRQYGYRSHLAVPVTDGAPRPRAVECHPDRPYYALSMCSACYKRTYDTRRRRMADAS